MTQPGIDAGGKAPCTGQRDPPVESPFFYKFLPNPPVGEKSLLLGKGLMQIFMNLKQIFMNLKQIFMNLKQMLRNFSHVRGMEQKRMPYEKEKIS